jgi:hypothetical protein
MREAANALIRVHKASTQNRKLRTKTSKISMSQRDNRKSCHSDQLSSHEKSSWGTIWGTKRSPREHLLCFFKHAANSLKPGHAAYAGDVRFVPKADSCSAAKQHPYSITSWACAMSAGGSSRPSALAVVRFMMKSNLVGCSTGMSPGLAPRRILST